MPPCWIPIVCSQSTILVDPRKSKIGPNRPNTHRVLNRKEPTGNGRKSFRNWMETQENKRKRPRSDWTVWKRTSVVEIEQNRVITDANVRSRTEPSGSVHWIRQMCRYLRVHHRLLRETSYSLFKTISDTNIEDTAQNKISRESKNTVEKDVKQLKRYSYWRP